MALPSQSARSDGRRSNMFRRKRLPRLPILLGAGVAIAGTVWFLLPEGGGDPQQASADPGAAPPAANQIAPASQRDTRQGGEARDDFGRPRRDRNAENTQPQQTNPTQPRSTGTAGPAGAESPAPAASRETSNTASIDSEGAAHTAQPAAPAANHTPTQSLTETRQQFSRGLQLLDSDPLEARRLLTRALDSRALPPEDEENIRMALAHLSERLVFGRTMHPQDSYARMYKVKSGDLLQKIVKDLDLQVHWNFLLRINGMKDARALRAGQDLKIITGPFHAVIDKSDYRLDLYMGDGDDRIFVRSFRVGLGEFDSTPPGMFRVGSKAENPRWVNPRNPREIYERDDPANPIGEHWIALIGIDEYTREFTGYGIHGTVEPESIGRQQSMGCVRMHSDDVALIYEVLMSDVSLVEIRN